MREQIVDDERLVAFDLQSGLEQLGYEVVGIAANVPAAVRMAEETRPDLVLMDINLKPAATASTRRAKSASARRCRSSS